MKKLLLSACAAAACWMSDAGAMNGCYNDYSSDGSSREYEVFEKELEVSSYVNREDSSDEDSSMCEFYEGKELDISFYGDGGEIDVPFLIRYGEFPYVERVTADLNSAFKIVYRSPVATCSAEKQLLVRWDSFWTVKELILKSNDEFEVVRRSLCDKLQYDFGLHVEIVEIPRIDTLEELNMSNLHIMTIPESIQNLGNLRELDLSGNSLEGLPQSIGNLSKLEHLYLGSSIEGEDSNNLKTLPDSIGNLTNLESLYLSACSLEKLPESIGNLRNLETLVLDSNPLHELPESIGNLTNLETLDITNCPLQRVPASIGNLTNLKNFFVDDYIILPPTVRNLKNLDSYMLEKIEKQIKE